MATGGTSTNGGYDCEFITVPPKSLECSICLLIVRQPHVISCCGNQFCQSCIGRIQNDNKPCPLCKDVNFSTLLHKGVMREVNSLMVRCTHKGIGCNWKGELGQLQEHLNPGASADQRKGCGYVRVECRYQCGEMFLRNAVQCHELHHCPMRPVEMQVSSLAMKLDSLSNKLDTMMTENDQLKRENQTQKAEIEMLKLQSERLKIQNERLDRESKEMKDMVDQIPSLRACAMPEPPFFFTCYNVAHFMRNNYRWWSSPFYSHTGGYKMKVDTFMNGLDSSKGKDLSLFVAIMRGEFDDKLQWPFSGKVAVHLYNFSNEMWDTLMKIDFKYATRDARVKPTGVNRPWGYGSFLSHKTLREHYLRDDIVRFKVGRVEF